MAAIPLQSPSVGKVQQNLMAYGAGLASGVGFNLVSGLTGSSLIGGAISSAVAGSLVEGVLGQMIAVNAGFAQGQRGIGALGMGNILGGLGGGAKKPAASGGQIATI
jgi:hypothetical protein